jgi:hypothetical protein
MLVDGEQQQQSITTARIAFRVSAMLSLEA